MKRLLDLFPLLETLKHYKKKDFTADLNAGITIGVLLIPQAMAYAMLAGIPPIYGLYASVIPPAIYALFGSSQHMAIGPVALTSILLLSGISRFAEVGSELYISLVITTGLMIGILQVAVSLLKLGFFVNFISYPVVSGFTSAAAIIIIVSQISHAFGIDIPRFPDSLGTVKYAVQHIGEIDWITFLIFGLSVISIYLIRRIHRYLPSGLIVMAVAILMSWLFRLDELGVAIVGSIPAGLPKLILPQLHFDYIIKLVPTVLTLMVIGIVSAMSMARFIESRHHYYEVRPDQEIMGIGMAKIVGAFFQALPTDGSFSRSWIASDTGGRTAITSIVSSVLVGVCLLFFTSLLYYLPLSVLSAVIIISVLGLFEFDHAAYLWKTYRSDFVMLLITFVVTLTVGVMEGVACGVILSVFIILYRSTKPDVVELGQVKGTTRYRSLARYEEAIRHEKILILRFDEQLYFANASFFKDSIRQSVRKYKGQIDHLILDASNIHRVDSTGIRVIQEVEQELMRQNITLHLSNVIGSVRDVLFKSGLLTEPDKHHMSIQEGVDFILENQPAPKIDYSKGPMQTNAFHPDRRRKS